MFKIKYLKNNNQGLILFAHGSRNATWRKPFDRLLRDIKKRGHAHTVLAFGEFMSPGLVEAAKLLAARGVKTAVIVPLFLGGGLHVRGDLPKLAAQARAASGVKLRVARAICDDTAVLTAIAGYCLTQVSGTPKNLSTGRHRAGGKP